MNKSLKTVNWKVFYLSDIFTNYHGKRLVKEQRKNGNIPLLTASESNQGVSDYISKNKNMTKHIDFISIDMFGHAFYHDYNCYGDDNIYFFKNNSISKQAKLFIVVCINKNSSKYSYGNQFRQDNADKDKIILPVNSKGEPDYKFMEEYIKEREAKLKNQYKEYIQKHIDKLQKKADIKNKKWENFKLSKIFSFDKGNQNNMGALQNGDIPLVSAKKVDNGYKNFVSKNNKKIFNGGCISLNNDGDGGAGIAYYQPYKMLLDSHCTALVSKSKLTKETLLFLSKSITKQRRKFGHGYAINKERLKAFQIMLPINSNGEPDYGFMHNYMLYLEQKKILEYLEYVDE